MPKRGPTTKAKGDEDENSTAPVSRNPTSKAANNTAPDLADDKDEEEDVKTEGTSGVVPMDEDEWGDDDLPSNGQARFIRNSHNAAITEPMRKNKKSHTMKITAKTTKISPEQELYNGTKPGKEFTHHKEQPPLYDTNNQTPHTVFGPANTQSSHVRTSCQGTTGKDLSLAFPRHGKLALQSQTDDDLFMPKRSNPNDLRHKQHIVTPGRDEKILGDCNNQAQAGTLRQNHRTTLLKGPPTKKSKQEPTPASIRDDISVTEPSRHTLQATDHQGNLSTRDHNQPETNKNTTTNGQKSKKVPHPPLDWNRQATRLVHNNDPLRTTRSQKSKTHDDTLPRRAMGIHQNPKATAINIRADTHEMPHSRMCIIEIHQNHEATVKTIGTDTHQMPHSRTFGCLPHVETKMIAPSPPQYPDTNQNTMKRVRPDFALQKILPDTDQGDPTPPAGESDNGYPFQNGFPRNGG